MPFFSIAGDSDEACCRVEGALVTGREEKRVPVSTELSLPLVSSPYVAFMLGD